MNLNKKQKTAYGMGAVGKDMVYSLVAGFLMYYYNDILGISATYIGILFMASRLFDAFNDPIMGVVVDRTKTKIGKFRPWLIVGTLLNAIILVFMFRVPESFTGRPLLMYTSVAYLFWGITYTMMDIPYWSLIPALTKPGKERENLSVIARSCAGFGFAIPVGLTMVLVPILGDGNERLGFSYFSMIIAVIFIITIGITVAFVKDKNIKQTYNPTIKEMFQSLLANDQAMIVVVAIVMFNTSLYLTQQLAIYFFKYDIGNVALFGIFGTVGGLAQIISMTLLPVLRKKYDCKQLLTRAVTATLIGYTLLLLLGVLNIKNIALLCVAAVIIFMGFGLATVLTTIFLADTVDYGEYKNGQRSESVIFSLQTFVVKLGSALSVLIAGIGIDVIKLDKDALKQSTQTLTGLRILMIVVPMVGLILTILFFNKKYKLTESRLAEISESLNSKQVSND